MKIYHLVFTFLLSISITAQKNVNNGWTEEKVTLEQSFMDANIQIMVGKYDVAIKILKDIYKKDSRNPGLNFQMAQVYGSLNDLPSAIKHGKKAVSGSPNNVFYNLLLGNLYLESNQMTEAVRALDRLIVLQPEETKYYDLLARAHLRTGNYNKAITTFDQLETLLGFSEEIALRKVDILDENGKSKEVIKVLQKLVAMYPETMRYRYNLASYYKNQGNDKDARKVYREILQLDPEDASANLAMLDNPDNLNDEKGYLSALQPLIESDKIPMDKKILEMIPYVERLGSEPELGGPLLKIGKTLVQLHPNEAKVHAMYADIFNGLGNIDKAIEQYEKTITLNDNVYTVWEQLIIAYGQKGDYTTMASRSEDAMDLFPNKASAYYLYASAKISSSQLDEVVDYLQDAQIIAGKDLYHKANVENQRARLAMKQNRYDAAAKHLSISIEWSMGQDPQSVELLGDLASLKSDNVKAIEYWKQAEKFGYPNPNLAAKIAKGSL